MNISPREKRMMEGPVDETKRLYVWTLVRDVCHLMEKARDRELRQYGLTVMQATVLQMINMLGKEASPSALARVMFREAPTVSSMLNRMEKQRLIKKVREGRRNGLIRLVLTQEGKKALADAQTRESIKRIMSQSSDETCRQMIAGLISLRRLVLQDLGLSPDGAYFRD